MSIVCESEFTTPDPKHPETSQHEIDFYQGSSHRLSLRLRYDPRHFEVYSKMYADNAEAILIACPDLQLSLDAGGKEWRRRFARDREKDHACEHVYPVKAESCEVTPDLTER